MGTPWVSFNGKDCSGCKHLNERGYCEFTACVIPCTVRATIPDVKPQTNADRIRSMTDEELAELWWERVDCGECPVHRDCRMTGQDCKKLALDWLRQEVDNAEDQPAP